MSIRDKFISQGYVVFPSLLEEAQINLLRVKCLGLLRRQIKHHKTHDMFDLFKKEPQAVKNCGKTMQGLPELYALACDKAILGAVKNIVKDPIIHTKPQVHFHHRDLAESEINWKTPPHIDQISMMGSLNSLVVWIPLVDCMNDDIGPLRLAPTSHLLDSQVSRIEGGFGLAEEWENEHFKSVYCKMKDVVMFSSNLVHSSGENITEDQPRWSVTLRYSDASSIDWIERNYHNPYLYKPITDENYSVSAEEMEVAFDNQDYRELVW